MAEAAIAEGVATARRATDRDRVRAISKRMRTCPSERRATYFYGMDRASSRVCWVVEPDVTTEGVRRRGGVGYVCVRANVDAFPRDAYAILLARPRLRRIFEVRVYSVKGAHVVLQIVREHDLTSSAPTRPRAPNRGQPLIIEAFSLNR